MSAEAWSSGLVSDIMPASPPTGAEVVVTASAAAGIEVCFANAGTTEMALVAALTKEPRIRAVPVLFEGVASGAADGYARIAGKPASVMVHLGPGLANAAANLHNAKRAQSPVVTWVGDHARWLAPYDPPLASDIQALASNHASWVHTASRADTLYGDAVTAVERAQGVPAGVSTLVLPMDLLEGPLATEQRLADESSVSATHPAIPAEAVTAWVGALRKASRPLILLGGQATDVVGQRLAGSLTRALDVDVMVEQFPRCLRRQPGLPALERLAYLPMQARAQLKAYDLIMLAGADRPICFFGYGNERPELYREGVTVVDPVTVGLTDPHRLLMALCDALDAPALALRSNTAHPGRLEVPAGSLHPESLCKTLAQHLPEEAIVVCEGISSSLPLYPALRDARPHDLLTCKGGAVGFGTPAATGAAIAAPERRVVAYVGDGSAAYTIQSLWTQAREGLDVTTLILANRKYAVLQMELFRAGGDLVGAGESLTDISRPELDFVSLARGFGVSAERVSDLSALSAALGRSFETAGPSLIEVMV